MPFAFAFFGARFAARSSSSAPVVSFHFISGVGLRHRGRRISFLGRSPSVQTISYNLGRSCFACDRPILCPKSQQYCPEGVHFVSTAFIQEPRVFCCRRGVSLPPVQRFSAHLDLPSCRLLWRPYVTLFRCCRNFPSRSGASFVISHMCRLTRNDTFRSTQTSRQKAMGNGAVWRKGNLLDRDPLGGRFVVLMTSYKRSHIFAW